MALIRSKGVKIGPNYTGRLKRKRKKDKISWITEAVEEVIFNYLWDTAGVIVDSYRAAWLL